MAMSSSTLLDLPDELLDHIASYLSQSDLITLRLVCWHVLARTANRFGDTSFSRLEAAFWLPHSFRKMRNVLTSQQCSSWVEQIVIYVDRPVLADENASHFSEGCPRDAELSEEYKTFIMDMRDQGGTEGTVGIYMSQIFEAYASKCSKRGDWPFVSINHKLEGKRTPLDMLNDRYGNLVSYLPNSDCSKSLTTIFQCMENSHLSPKNFAIGDINFGIAVKLFRQLSSIFNQNSYVFSSVAILYLTIQATPLPQDMASKEEDTKCLAAFCESLAPRLEAFYYITQRNMWPSETDPAVDFSSLVAFRSLCDDGVVFTKLEHLFLRLLILDKTRLLDFLSRHKSTLRTLGMKYVWLEEQPIDWGSQGQDVEKLSDDSWKDAFLEELQEAEVPCPTDMEEVYGCRVKAAST